MIIEKINQDKKMVNNYIFNIEQAILTSISIFDNKLIDLLISKGLVYDDFTSLPIKRFIRLW